MASTRSKNSKLEYKLETMKNKNVNEYLDYTYKYHNPQPAYPGFGFTPTKIPNSDITFNNITLESQLFGINANNLVNPQKEQKPQYKSMKTWDLVKKEETILPKPLVIEKNQRPLL